jgi:hypothetical protein
MMLPLRRQSHAQNGEMNPMLERRVIRGLLFFFAFLQSLASRFYIEPDGVNYLDSARAYLHHDWSLALNGWWSPLYSWLLALSLFIFRPSPRMESTLLHLLNFAIFVVTLLSFEFFLSQAIDDPYIQAGSKETGVSLHSLWLLGYALFAFSTLFLISVRLDTPDLCVACLTFLAAALVLRIRSGKARLKTFLLLAVVLTLAYYAKTIMFLLAFVFFFCAGIGIRLPAKRVFQLFTSVALFLVLTSPLVYFLSVRAGHPTFGDIGRIAYARYVNGVPDPVHWQAGVPGTGHPLHPMAISSTKPPVYIYSQPFRTSYPPWYDGSYWYAGVTPHFELRGQLRVLRDNLRSYYLEFSTRREFIVGFLALAFVCTSWRIVVFGVLQHWPIWAPAAAAFCIYAVVYAEPRYLGASFTLFWIAMFLGVRRGCSEVPTRFTNSLILAIVFLVAITCVRSAAGDLHELLSAMQNQEWEAAKTLRSAGLSSGQGVAIIGHSNVADYWAHLAELSISAEITREDAPAFWQAPPDEKSRIFDEFGKAGARAVVTTFVPSSNSSEWIRLGQSPYYAFFLNYRDTPPPTKLLQTPSTR